MRIANTCLNRTLFPLSVSGGITEREKKAAEYTARIDRLPAFPLPWGVLLALAFGYFIALYDVIDVGIVLPYLGFNAAQASLIASLGLFGYIPGAVALGYMADKVGRKPALIFTALLTMIGSLGNAISNSFPVFALFRFITGAGIGGDLILVPTYLIEMVPAAKRGEYFNLVYIAGWAGLGLGPFLASQIVLANPSIGWRIVFALSAALAFIVLIIRAEAYETVRFLALKGKFDEAEKAVRDMEQRAMKRAGVTSLPEPQVVYYPVQEKNPFAVLANPKYRLRILMVFLSIFFFYFGEYPYLVLFTTWTGDVLNFSQSLENTVTFYFGLAGIATFLGAIALHYVIDRVRRAYLTVFAYFVGMLIGVAIASYGAFTMNVPVMVAGFMLTNFIGVGWSNQLNYLNGTENAPTYARATSFALTDGVGHLGAALSLLFLFPLMGVIGDVPAWIVYQIPMVLAGIGLIFVLPNALRQRLENINEASAGI